MTEQAPRPNLWRNPLSLVGATVAVVALLTIAFLLLLEAVSATAPPPYADLVIFLFLPAVIMGGLSLALAGWWWSRRRWLRTGVAWAVRWPVLDLNEPTVRRRVAIWAAGLVGFLFVSAFGSFQAYEATESTAFCGAVCHSVMGPQYTAYRHSPHARVDCVKCHVGPGFDWHVRSKLTGVRQLYALLTGTVSRPIPVPIHNLRPARDTCEGCHWPEKHFAYKLRRYTYFLADEANTRWELDLAIHVGGGEPGTPEAGGIHWHMRVENKVEYVASDPERKTIPWVRSTDPVHGTAVLYKAEDAEAQPPPDAHWRLMDCLDCHNRPAHRFLSPRDAVNAALAGGQLDPSLPSLKAISVDLLTQEYDSSAAAQAAIAAGLPSFYAEKFPQLARTRSDAIAAAARTLQLIYRRNFFPHMKVRWDVYADHSSHLLSPGCMRCHDGKHRSASGQTINSECRSCHLVLAQGPPEQKQFSHVGAGLDFEHPADVGEDWRESPCWECHSGAAP